VAVITVISMKPKILPVLEMCVENGIARGFNRAFKHTDSPNGEQIKDSIAEAIMFEIWEWFDFDVTGGVKDDQN
jgi:hypothetical protein